MAASARSLRSILLSYWASMLEDSSLFVFAAVVATSVLWKKLRDEKSYSPEVCRFRHLVASGKLVHPFLRAECFHRNTRVDCANEYCVSNFTDLASALATCCGVETTAMSERARDLAADIQTSTRHIIVILCDGMGNSILEQHLPEWSFLRENNQSDRLRAVYPSTTPAALTTLATAQWPGQHGVPGWDLREQPGCDYPGGASGGSITQLRILAPRVMNVRTNEPANYSSLDDVFLAPPWSRAICDTSKTSDSKCRRMMYINAFNGDEFPSWYQGKTHDTTSRASDFSSWQTGTVPNESSTLLDVATIGETAFSTLGEPEGSQTALEYFRDGVMKALCFIAQAEAKGESTYTYLYTAHPDKHMHALGTNHQEVNNLVLGLDGEIDAMWKALGDRSKLLESIGVETKDDPESGMLDCVDAALIVTADHGHVTVSPKDMVVLPDSIIECLEYANIGVHGKGRHGYLHCRAGLQSTLRERWRASPALNDSFLLLTIEEASEEGLFGPNSPLLRVRPRLGDFVAIAITEITLVTPNEWDKHKNHCQGAHGSLLAAEMKIPFILCKR